MGKSKGKSTGASGSRGTKSNCQGGSGKVEKSYTEAPGGAPKLGGGHKGAGLNNAGSVPKSGKP